MSLNPTEGTLRSGRSNRRARRGRRLTAGLAAGGALALAVGVTAPAAATPPEPKTVAPAAVPNAQKSVASVASVAGKAILQEIRGNRVTVPAFGFAASNAQCPAGQEAAAGGWILGSDQFIVPVMSFSFGNAVQHDSWQVQFHNPGDQDYFFAQAIAYCSANT